MANKRTISARCTRGSTKHVAIVLVMIYRSILQQGIDPSICIVCCMYMYMYVCILYVRRFKEFIVVLCIFLQQSNFKSIMTLLHVNSIPCYGP